MKINDLLLERSGQPLPERSHDGKVVMIRSNLRFGTCRAPEAIEMLSDSGSPYTARETRIFARQLGLKPCFTPMKSPQSNGMAEALVHTFKRDHVRVNPLPDAETVLELIGGWIEDYNENHPHSALRWRSPREFRRAQTETA